MSGRSSTVKRRNGSAGRGTSVEKRSKKDAATCVSDDIDNDNGGCPAAAEVERLDLLKGVSNLGHSASTGMHKTTSKTSVVDFEQILKESLGDEFVRVNAQQPALSALEHADIPEMVRCGGDAIAFHVPEANKRKIGQHEFVNGYSAQGGCGVVRVW